jgi:SLOG cluster2/TIR domain
MTYPLPLQVHVIWHYKSEDLCPPLAEKIYLALNRDVYQPLVPGIGIPVFFRFIGQNPRNPTSPPAPIAVADTEFDLRIVLLTSEFVVDPVWREYRAEQARQVQEKGDHAALITFALHPGITQGGALVVFLDQAGERTGELLLQHVLLQACRLLGRRPRPDPAARGAAPMKLFLSHTKRDQIGLQTARALKVYLDNLAVDRFFDEVSIQPGDNISRELEAEIHDSVLVAIRTDGYAASPWCRKELALAKRANRPMVIVDSLSGTEPRCSLFFTNLASIRVTPATATQDDLARVCNFIALEVLRFLHADRQLFLLKKEGMLPQDAILLSHAPEPRDFSAIPDAGNSPPAAGVGRVFVHPDPVLALEEAEDFSAYHATFVTPISLWSKRLDGLRLGISASASDASEIAALGLSPLHIEDAVRMLARQALSADARLVYGGALSPGNFTEALFEMIATYNRGGLVAFPPLINYTPWPWFQEVDANWLAQRLETLDQRPCNPPADVAEIRAGDGPGHVQRLAATAQGRYALARSLSSMRQRITEETEARVVLGGKLQGYFGLLPGIIEEAHLAIRKRQPLYVAGGFGGAARVIAEALDGRKPNYLTREFQEQISAPYAETLALYEQRQAELDLPDMNFDHTADALATYGIAGLSAANGLTPLENRELFATGSVDAALHLIMKGLASLGR